MNARETVVERLAEAGISTEERFIRCKPGQKATVDHTLLPKPPEQNFGVYATARDNLVLVDVDDPEKLEIELPETFRVSSPHGDEERSHRYYYAETTDDGRLPTAVFKERFDVKNPAPTWGEVRTANQYVVGPGSQLAGCDKDWCDECASDDGGRYRIVDDREIAKVSAEVLAAALATDTTLADYEGDETSADREEPMSGASVVPDDLEKRLEKALEKDEKLARLWGGDTGDYGGDRSRAECALAQKLGWWFGNHKPAVRRLMDRSGAEKWGERTDESYRSTVLEAVDRNSDCYTPGRRKPKQTAADGGAAAVSPVEATATTNAEGPTEKITDILGLWREGEYDKQTANHKIAIALVNSLDFAMPRDDAHGVRPKLHVYNDQKGIYEPNGEQVLKERCETLLNSYLDNATMNEILGKVKRMSYKDNSWFKTPPERLVVGNGILDLTTARKHPYTPDEFHTTRIKWDWKPSRTECPEIDRFLHQIVRDHDVRTLYQLIGHALYKSYPAEKAAMLVGDGENGKSILISLIEEFLGTRNVSNRSLQALSDDQFAAADLDGKLANIHPDMGDDAVYRTTTFKALTGNDNLAAERKYEQPYKFKNHATLMFAANKVPKIDDDTRANWRRWILIDFPNTFRRDDPEFVEKRVLLDRITAEEEMEGLLVRAVWAFASVYSTDDFPGTRDPSDAREQMKKAAEPVYAFAQNCVKGVGQGNWEYSADIHSVYKAYCDDEELATKSKSVFFRELNNQKELDLRKSKKSGQAVYYGIEFTSRGMQYLEGRDDGRQAGL